MSVNTALIRFIYPQRMLGRGIGINAVVVAISSAAGPTIASGILSMAHWPWLFAVNVPLGILAVTIGWRALPKTPRATHGFDLAGAALSALAFGFLIGAIDAGGHGNHGVLIATELAIALGCGFLLVRRERGRPAPLFPVDLLRNPVFALSVATSICSFVAQMLALVALPFHLQQQFGFTAVQIGLLITPWPLAIAVAALIAGHLADRYPAGLLGGLGLLAFTAGLLALAFLPRQPEYGDIAWRMVLCGLGFGFFQSPNNRALLSSAPRHRSGGASGMLGTARLLGQTIGAALVALLFGQIPAQATLCALYIAAGFAFVAACVSSLRLFHCSPTTGMAT
jgi:DHA2 family multidrug resistance protein-like MFS transporter